MTGRLLTILAAGTLALTTANVRATKTADVIFVVDESGSMSGEHAWIGGMVNALDAALINAGVTGNRYGLVGFGASGGGGHGIAGHSHSVGGSQFGTASQLATAAGGLVISGGTEDGYSGIMTALSYTFRTGAAINVILVTDEDRDNYVTSLNYTGVLNALLNQQALLNAVVNASLKDGANQTALGVDSTAPVKNAYKANGSGGFVISPGGYAASGFGTTIANYINLAWATGGAAWDLNQLRLGGNTALSFTEAFVDIKVQEIVAQVPDGGAAWLLLTMALTGLQIFRRRIQV